MAIVIDVGFKGSPALTKLNNTVDNLKKVNKQFDSLAGKINTANTGLARMNLLLLNVAQNAKSAANAIGAIGGARISTGGSGTSRGPRVTKPPLAYAHDPKAGMNYYAQAAAAGDPRAGKLFAKYRNMYGAAQRNQASASAYSAVQNHPLGAQLLNAVSRTRFGKMGGQILGVDMMSLLGGPGGAGAISAIQGFGAAGAAGEAGMGAMGAAGLAALASPIGIAVAALTGLAVATALAKNAMSAWGQSLVSGGGSVGQARAANALSQFTGVDVAGVGKNMGPVAAGIAGVGAFTGPFGANDYNARGLAIIDKIRNASSFDQARRIAELAGSPDLAKVKFLSQGSYDALRGQPNSSGGAAGIQSSAEFDAAVINMKTALESLAVGATPLIQGFADLTSAAAAAIKVFKDIDDAVHDFVARLLGGKSEHSNALRDNTRAIQENTNQYREGTYGGGPRTRGAVPRNLNGLPGSGYSNADYGLI
jgi:hypothetical protein